MTPDSVKVLGQTFAIVWTGKTDVLSDRARLGRTVVDKQLIHIDHTLGDDQQRDTLLHEIIHASLRLVGADLSERTEEKVAGLLAPILLDALRSNPAVAAWLTE